MLSPTTALYLARTTQTVRDTVREMHSCAHELARDRVLSFDTSKRLQTILAELAAINRDIDKANTIEAKQARRNKHLLRA